MADNKEILDAINTVFGLCDLVFWYDETYWMSVNGEQSSQFPELDWDDCGIVNAFWSLLSILMLYAEKNGIADLGLDGLTDDCGILRFDECLIDSGFGNVLETAWLNACERYGYEYPENLNFNPLAGASIIEGSPCVNEFGRLDYQMQVSLSTSDWLNENNEGLPDEEYLEARRSDIEYTASAGDNVVYCLINKKLWDLQKKIRCSGLDLSEYPGLKARYEEVTREISAVCDVATGYADGDRIFFEDGREAYYSIVPSISDESGYELIIPPLLYNANITGIFRMAEIDDKLKSVSFEIEKMIKNMEMKNKQTKKSPCA